MIILSRRCKKKQRSKLPHRDWMTIQIKAHRFWNPIHFWLEQRATKAMEIYQRGRVSPLINLLPSWTHWTFYKIQINSIVLRSQRITKILSHFWLNSLDSEEPRYSISLIFMQLAPPRNFSTSTCLTKKEDLENTCFSLKAVRTRKTKKKTKMNRIWNSSILRDAWYATILKDFTLHGGHAGLAMSTNALMNSLYWLNVVMNSANVVSRIISRT